MLPKVFKLDYLEGPTLIKYSGYPCTNLNGQTCVSTASSTNFPVMTCQSGTSGGLSYLVLPTTISSTSVSFYSLFAPMIQMNWKACDLPDATSLPNSQGTTMIPMQQPPLGLSTAEKAGIVVGVMFGVIGIVAFLVTLHWRRRYKYAEAGQISPMIMGPMELGEEKTGPYFITELPRNARLAEPPHIGRVKLESVCELQG